MILGVFCFMLFYALVMQSMNTVLYFCSQPRIYFWLGLYRFFLARNENHDSKYSVLSKIPVLDNINIILNFAC